MASIDARRLAIEPQLHDATSLARDAFDLHGALTQEKKITLRLDLHVENVTVCCDHDRTLQVFSNLLGNAIKFCKAGDAITIGADLVDGSVRFSVTDSGPGIAPSDLPRLFDAYWSAKRHAKKGTGLGLYISKGIVEAQRGTIAASSQPGHTRFEFTIPSNSSCPGGPSQDG
jgi:signal transduction histidine kinase